MRRNPYSRVTADVHSLGIWLRADREPLKSFVHILGDDGDVTDYSRTSVLEAFLNGHVRGCISASVGEHSAGPWKRRDDDGADSIRVQLTFRTVDDLISFRDHAQAP